MLTSFIVIITLSCGIPTDSLIYDIALKRAYKGSEATLDMKLEMIASEPMVIVVTNDVECEDA